MILTIAVPVKIPRIYECLALMHAKLPPPNPESRIPNPESRIPNPESRVPSPESRVPFPLKIR
jgi:hypothetical protein